MQGVEVRAHKPADGALARAARTGSRQASRRGRSDPGGVRLLVTRAPAPRARARLRMNCRSSGGSRWDARRSRSCPPEDPGSSRASPARSVRPRKATGSIRGLREQGRPPPPPPPPPPASARFCPPPPAGAGDLLIERLVGGDHSLCCEVVAQVALPPRSPSPRNGGGRRAAHGAPRRGPQIVGIDEESGLALHDDLGNSADPRGDHRDSSLHGLENDERHRLEPGRDRQQTGPPPVRPGPLHPADELNAVVEALRPHEPLKTCPLRTIPCEDEPATRHAGQGFDEQVETLLWCEPPDPEDQARWRRRHLAARRGGRDAVVDGPDPARGTRSSSRILAATKSETPTKRCAMRATQMLR